MRVVANRQLTGHYGVVSMGQEFDANEDVARQLLRAGLVKRPDPPAMVYETKVIVPEVPEAAPRGTFRDVPLPDPEPAGMAPESDREFQRQTYRRRELMILADGQDVRHLVPEHDPRIRLIHLDGWPEVGAKRNYGCERAAVT